MRRVLAVRQDNNGDVTLIGPAVRALAASASVVLVCGPSGEGAARLLPCVDEVIVARADWIEGRPQAVDAEAIAGFVERIRSLELDEAFIFTSFHQSPLPTALLLRLARVELISAYSVDYPGSLLDRRVQADDDIHEVERALALVGVAGYHLPEGDDGALRYLEVPDVTLALPPRYLVLQPGATVEARTWSPLRWRSVVRRLCFRGYAVVVVGSPAEMELCRTVAGGSAALDLAGGTSFAQFAALVRQADAIVVGNTSGIHVAAAVGTPVVSVFPPTIPPRRFAPWRVPHALLGDHQIACAGCRTRTCPIPGQPCIGTVGENEVVAALQSLGVRPAREAV